MTNIIKYGEKEIYFWCYTKNLNLFWETLAKMATIVCWLTWIPGLICPFWRLIAAIQPLLSKPWRKLHTGLHLLKKLRCDKRTKIQFKTKLFINKPFVVLTKAAFVFLSLLLPEELVETLPELAGEDLLYPLHGSFPFLCCHFLSLICCCVIVLLGTQKKG